MAASDLYRIQKLIHKLSDEREEAKDNISSLMQQRAEITKQINSLNDGISYLERMENEIIRREEQRDAKFKSRRNNSVKSRN